MIATGLFAEKIPGFDVIGEDGAFKGGNGGILAWNLAGALSITLWSGGLAGIVVSYFFFVFVDSIVKRPFLNIFF